MKTNEDTVLIGEKVILVPYRPEHVPKYHEWMCDEELRRLTASEPLSLEEEYEMQQNWQMDEDKLTFIVLARNGNSQTSHETNASKVPLVSIHEGLVPTDPLLHSLPMVGDVNMFLRGKIPRCVNLNNLELQRPLDEGEDEDFEAEVEIMVAEPSYRRQGFAFEALKIMLRYATGAPSSCFGGPPSASSDSHGVSPLKIPPAHLVTRISESNISSIRLFEKLGFKVTKRVEVFGEVEMRWFLANTDNISAQTDTSIRSRNANPRSTGQVTSQTVYTECHIENR